MFVPLHADSLQPNLSNQKITFNYKVVKQEDWNPALYLLYGGLESSGTTCCSALQVTWDGDQVPGSY